MRLAFTMAAFNVWVQRIIIQVLPAVWAILEDCREGKE